MNVRDLIDELSRMPQHVPVRVFVPMIYGGNDNQGQFNGEMEIPLSKDSDATEADIVRFEGNHVLIEGK